MISLSAGANKPCGVTRLFFDTTVLTTNGAFLRLEVSVVTHEKAVVLCGIKSMGLQGTVAFTGLLSFFFFGNRGKRGDAASATTSMSSLEMLVNRVLPA